MGRKIIIPIIFIGCVLLFIFCIFLYCRGWFCNLHLSNELIPFDVISLFVTSFIALYIAWYIAKKLTSLRYEREYLIKDLQQIDTEVFYLSSLVTESTEVPITDVTVKLNKIKIIIDRFQRTTQLVGLTKIKNDSINHCYFAIYDSMTNVDRDALELTPDKKNEIQNRISDFTYKIRGTIFQINKC